jgi:hypothetical protein
MRLQLDETTSSPLRQVVQFISLTRTRLDRSNLGPIPERLFLFREASVVFFVFVHLALTFAGAYCSFSRNLFSLLSLCPPNRLSSM